MILLNHTPLRRPEDGAGAAGGTAASAEVQPDVPATGLEAADGTAPESRPADDFDIGEDEWAPPEVVGAEEAEEDADDGEGEAEAELEPEPEAEAAEAKPEGDAEDEPEQRGWPEKAIAEVSKLRQRARAAEAEREALTAERAALTAERDALRAAKVIPAESREHPMPDVLDEQTLRDRQKSAELVKDWLDDNWYALQGGERLECPLIKANGKPIEVDAALAQRLRDATRADLRAIPQRQAYLQACTNAERQLLKDYPELKDPQHPLAKQMHSLVQMFPEIKRVPTFQWALLDAAVGQTLRTKLGADLLKQLNRLGQAPATPATSAPPPRKAPLGRTTAKAPAPSTPRTAKKTGPQPGNDLAALYGVADDEY